MQTKTDMILPQILLSHPQMGENIGAAARIMRNFGLKEMALIAPRDGWPNPQATAMAAGAFAQMKPVRVFQSTAQAISELHYVVAVTARTRSMEKPVYGLQQCMQQVLERMQQVKRTGFLFGPEASGLTNSDVATCDAVLTFDVDAAFNSLNLAQAIAVTVSAWRETAGNTQSNAITPLEIPGSPIASKKEMLGMIEHLQGELRSAGYFFPAEKENLMMQNLQNMFVRSEPTVQELQTFRGAIRALAKGRGKARSSDNS